MTKVAYVLKMYPRFSETFIVNEILELEQQGVDVRIYSLRKPDDGRFHASLSRVKAGVIYVPQYPQMEPERVHAAHARLHQAVLEPYRALRTEVEARQDPFLLKRFIQAGVVAAHLLEHPVDALHAHFASSATRVTSYVHRLLGLPYSFTAHAKDIFHQDVNPGSLAGKMRDAAFVVTVSDFNRRYLQEVLAGRPGDVRRLYNGIDLQAFQPDPAAPRAANLILGVGRLVEKKGFADLVRACALLAEWGIDFQCEIVGTGEQRESLRKLIDALGLAARVHLAGARPQDQVLAAYRRATVFALPCIVAADGNRDGLPTVLLEAMAAGLPVVSTDLVGVPEIVAHEVEGLLVPPGDYQALAASLAQVLADPELRARLAAAGRRKVETQFDVRQNVAQLRAWLAESGRNGTQPSTPARMHPGAAAAGPQDTDAFPAPSQPLVALPPLDLGPVPALEQVLPPL